MKNTHKRREINQKSPGLSEPIDEQFTPDHPYDSSIVFSKLILVKKCYWMKLEL